MQIVLGYPISVSIHFRPLIDHGFTLARQIKQQEPRRHKSPNPFRWKLWDFKYRDLAAVLFSSECLGIFALVVGVSTAAGPQRLNPAFWIESSILIAEQLFEEFVQLAKNTHDDKIGPDRITQHLGDGQYVSVALKKCYKSGNLHYELYTTVDPVGRRKMGRSNCQLIPLDYCY